MTLLHGEDLRQAFSASTRCLERYRDTINALNVFPVPDGDTGTNMLLTMRSAMAQFPSAPIATAGEAADTLAQGAFWGARGNSGVILSQFFKGFADALHGKQACGGADLADGFIRATQAAYASVGQPVEGTMLTVIRHLSLAADGRLAGGESWDALSLWEAAFESARDSLYQTPFQLDVLREAGVVDAGGMGMVVIMGAALCHLTGREESQVDQAVAGARIDPIGSATVQIDPHYLESTQGDQWGYCTQFLIQGDGLSTESIREHLSEMATSAVVVGDQRLVRVHIHAPDPGPALSYGAALGQLAQIDIQNMSQQNLEFAAETRSAQSQADQAAVVGVVAVTTGEGLARLFREIGCAAVVNGGQTMNPSVQALLEAAHSCGSNDVILLPNNKNVVAAAEQAAAAANGGIHLVPSKSVPQGVAAMLSYNPEESLERNLAAMRDALDSVISIEVTQAVRATNMGGMPIAEGQYIGLREGELASVESTPQAALGSALSQAGLYPESVVTVYWGAATGQGSAEEMGRQLEEGTPGIQVDLVYGGQPHYQYLASVE